jgi:hypothetical protein
MNKSRYLLGAVFLLPLVITLYTPVCAQSGEYKGEVFAKAGYGSLGDDEGGRGRGLVAGGGLGYRLTPRWGAEFEVTRNAARRETSSFVMDGYALLVGGGVNYHFLPEAKAQPYLRLGLSYGHYDGKFISKAITAPPGFPGTPETVRSGKQNFIGPDFGVGVKIFASERISIRPEFRFAALKGAHSFDPARDILEQPLFAGWFSIGVGYHW